MVAKPLPRETGLWPRNQKKAQKGVMQPACPVCRRLDAPVNEDGTVRHHRDPDGYVCEGAGVAHMLAESKPVTRIQAKEVVR